jgi:arylsulfatase A-like enzyme
MNYISRYFLIAVTHITLLLLTGCYNEPVTPTQSEKPNIIFIYADDLGYGDLGVYGQSDIRTPNLDKMASEGMLFTQAYAGHTVCAPSRSALLTGMHTGKTQIRGNISRATGDRVFLPDSTVTVAKILAAQGYTNGIFGKWGLGEAKTEGIPTRQGFHEFYGFLNQARAHGYCADMLWHNEEIVFLPENAAMRCGVHNAEWYQQKLLDFIIKNKENPFFIYYATQLPHSELRSTDQDLKHYLDDKGTSIFNEIPYYGSRGPTEIPFATYAAMVTQLDRHVGEIVDLLEKEGLSDNTLIIFTSDNGPHRSGGYNPDYFNSSGGLRGEKRDLYEGGVRVPMIAKWQGKIQPGSVSDYLWAAWDLLPTVAELAGAQSLVPDHIDGVSAVPVLMGEIMERPNEIYYENNGETGQVQVFGDMGVSVRKGKWKAITNVSLLDDLELYDLEQDPKETKNLALQYPEKVRELKKIIIETRLNSIDWPISAEVWQTFIEN